MPAAFPPTSKGLSLMVAFIITSSGSVPAQYAVGLRMGPSTFIPISSSGANATESISGLVLGAALQLIPDDGTGYRFALDHVTRVFDIDLRNGFTSRREQQSIRSTFIQLTSQVRFPLGKGSHVYFDFGPSIGAQLSEHRRGAAFYTDYPGQEDTLFVDERTTDNGARHQRHPVTTWGQCRSPDHRKALLQRMFKHEPWMERLVSERRLHDGGCTGSRRSVLRFGE